MIRWNLLRNIKTLIIFVLIAVVTVIVYLSTPFAREETIDFQGFTAINIKDLEQKSEIGFKENVDQRAEYELKMIVDPSSQQLPENIYQKENRFTSTLPNRTTLISGKGNQTTEISETPWTSMGPPTVGGRTRAMALDILDERIILAGGTSGGMWKTENLGNTWKKTTDPEDLHSVTTITQDTRPGKEHIWYYGTGELVGNSARGGGSATYRGDGIFKSNDNGETWSLLPATSTGNPNEFSNPFQFVWKVITNHRSMVQDEVYAATFGGIQRSTDGGDNWQYVIGEGTNSSSYYSDIAINNQGIFYATLSQSGPDSISNFQGIYRSADGLNWTDITPEDFPDAYDRVVIGTASSNPNIVYFLADSDPNDLWKYTYVSGNGSQNGGKWDNLTANIPMLGGEVGDFESQGSYNMLVKVHPSDANLVFLGGTNLYRSSDGFASSNNTSWIGGYSNFNDVSSYPGHHPDQHNLIFKPSDPSLALSSHDGGISITGNILAEEVTWTSINNGYITSQFYALAISDKKSDPLITGGMQDNGSHLKKSNNNNEIWERLIGGDGGFAAIGHQGSNVYVSSQNSRILRFVPGEENFFPVARIDPVGAGQKEDQEYLFINPFVIDPNNNSRMYLAGGDKIWRNNNVTQIPGTSDSTSINWSALNETTIDQGQVSALAISKAPKNILYYGTTEGEIFRVTDADGYQPQRNEISDTVFPVNAYVACIDIDPLDANHIFIVFSNYNVLSLFHSTDGGQSFEAVSGNLEENPDGSGSGPSIRWAKIIPMENNQYLYLAATSAGLFSTSTLDDVNTIWAQEGENIIGNIVVSMIQYRSADGLVAISTHGNGIYTKFFDNILVLEDPANGAEFSLEQNFPNPFSDYTTIRYSLPVTSFARIRLYNEDGKKIRTLLLTQQYKGNGEIIWDGKDGNGVNVASGTYYCRLEYGTEKFNKKTITRKILLIR